MAKVAGMGMDTDSNRDLIQVSHKRGRKPIASDITLLPKVCTGKKVKSEAKIVDQTHRHCKEWATYCLYTKL